MTDPDAKAEVGNVRGIFPFARLHVPLQHMVGKSVLNGIFFQTDIVWIYCVAAFLVVLESSVALNVRIILPKETRKKYRVNFSFLEFKQYSAAWCHTGTFQHSLIWI